MTTVSAFNEMMDQFLTELNLTFPKNKGVIKFQSSFEVVKRTNPSHVLENFMNCVKPYGKKIMAKDDSFITEDTGDIEFLNDIDLKSMWSESSDSTKSAIWQYLHTLLILGTTIQSLPKDTLNMIEEMAKKCADQMTNAPGGDGALSLMDLMNTISQQK
jgi:hypothetical protein